MKLVILKRKKKIPGGRLAISAYSIALGVVLFAIILHAAGRGFFEVLRVVALSFTSPTIVLDLLALIMLGYALVVPFKSATWNIGAEGQFFIATIPVVYLLIVQFREPPIPPGLMVMGSLVLAGLAGACWALIAGFVKVYARVDEVPITLILNYVAYYIVNYLVYGPFRGKYVYGYNRTDELPPSYSLNVYLRATPPPEEQTAFYPLVKWLYDVGYQLTYYAYWLLATVVVAASVWFLLNKTTLGLRIKALGYNPDFLLASGVNVKRYYLIALAISGFLAGLTGAVYLLSYAKRLTYPVEAQTAGYGYLAILVTWLSQLEPKYIPLMAYVVGALRGAGISLQIAGLGSLEQSLLVIGTVLLSYSVLSFLSDYEIRVVRG